MEDKKDVRKLLTGKEFKAKEVYRKIADSAREDIKSGDISRIRKGRAALEKAMKSKMFKQIAKKGLKALPVVGGIATAISSKDASAAVPVLGDSEAAGPKKGTPGYDIENPDVRGEKRRKLIESLVRKKRMNK